MRDEELESVGTIDVRELYQGAWRALAELQSAGRHAKARYDPKDLSGRAFDEAQVAGRRVTFAVERFLRIADENQSAFENLISNFGVRHWTHWNLLRPVLESALLVHWVLGPADSKSRRQRGLRVEVVDSREQRKWVESLVPAGLPADEVAKVLIGFSASEQTYKREASELGITWNTACQRFNLVQDVPKLDLGTPGISDYIVSIWRRLSGFQHGHSYALLARAEQMKSERIPGGRSIFLVVNDDDFIQTCKVVNHVHLTAWDRYIGWQARSWQPQA